jgi:hypothetical protein
MRPDWQDRGPDVSDDTEQPMYVQNVAAVDGFAYGVIGADIHVFAGGIPLYFLVSWPCEIEIKPDPAGRTRAASFADVEDELADLRRWRDSHPVLAARWLHGSAEQDTAQLVARLAAESEAAAWKVITALQGPHTDRLAAGKQHVSPDGAVGLLVIVQHADQWTAPNLTWLLKNALFHRSDTQTRILMVASSAGRWPEIRALLDTYQAATSGQPVPAPTRQPG